MNFIWNAPESIWVRYQHGRNCPVDGLLLQLVARVASNATFYLPASTVKNEVQAYRAMRLRQVDSPVRPPISSRNPARLEDDKLRGHHGARDFRGRPA